MKKIALSCILMFLSLSFALAQENSYQLSSHILDITQGKPAPNVKISLYKQQADGKWNVVDCYTGWYGYDLPIGELKQTIQNVKEENAAFKEIHP